MFLRPTSSTLADAGGMKFKLKSAPQIAKIRSTAAFMCLPHHRQ
jgi:hypothetical protein